LLAGDVAIIEGGRTVIVNVNATCATLQVGSSGNGTLNFSSGGNWIMNVSGNVTVNSGSKITSATNGNTYTFNIGGNISCAGTWDMWGKGNTDDINVVLNGSNQTISGTGTFGWNTLTVNSGSITTVSSSSAQTINKDLTINGTLDLGTTTFNRASAGGTLTVSGTMILGGSTGGQTGNNFPKNFSTITLTSGTVVYNLAGAQTVYATPTYTNLTFAGSGAKTFPAGTTTVNGVLSMEGTATATLTGTLTYGASATLQYKGSAAQITGAEFPASFTTGQLSTIKIENANGVTLNAAKNIGARSFTIGSIVANSVFKDGGYQLTSTGALNLTSGSYIVTYSSFPAFTGGTTIATGTTVNYAATATQTVKGITYSNLTISGTGTNSKTGDADITVNGILTLSSANASSTHGCLEMSTYTLNMGTTATTAGTGDVTGIVKRTNGSFVNNTQYSFGNKYTTVTFLGISGGTKPGWLSCKITIGAVPIWRTGAIQRVYTFAKDAAATDEVIVNLHYLDSELNSNTESKLVLWDAQNGPTWSPIDEHGKSNNDATNNWVGLTGLTVNYVAPTNTLDNKQWSLDDYSATKNTWTGADGTYPTKWDVIANWSGGHVPLTTDDVLIPGGLATGHYPVLTLAVEVQSIEIESTASVNAGNYTMTINGYTGAWINSGTFTSTGTVIFSNGNSSHIVSMSGSGSNNLYNLTINDNTHLQLATGVYVKIAGTVTPVGSGSIVDLGFTVNTIEYNGSGQSIINPVSGYSNLVQLKNPPSKTAVMYVKLLAIFLNLPHGQIS
jgi:hypothetical protein